MFVKFQKFVLKSQQNKGGFFNFQWRFILQPQQINGSFFNLC